MDVNNKVAVITGGSSGIGLCIIRKLLGSNIKYVAVFELDTPKAKEVLDNLKNVHNERIDLYFCDVTDSASVSSNFDKVIEKHGSIDIFINNAGILNEHIPERVIDVNFKAVVLNSFKFIDHAGKHKNGKGGVIVNIASVLGLVNVDLPVYSATKHAVVSFTRILKLYYDNTGIRVVAICPGFTDTPIVHKLEDKNVELKLTKPFCPEDYFIFQSPENVASAVVSIIERGKNGDIWVSEDNGPPSPVEEKPEYSLKLIKKIDDNLNQ